MSTENTIDTKLNSALVIEYLQIENESSNHNVPPGSESHFKLVIVAEKFEDLSLVRRHQLIYSILQDELQQGVHALSLHTLTPEEWRESNGHSPQSPPCLGGS